MVTTFEHIDYKERFEKAVLTMESQQLTIASQQLTIQSLQIEMLLLKKMLFGSRHEKFVAPTEQLNAPTLFEVPAIAEVIATTTTTLIKEKTTTRLQPNHKGRNAFPEQLRREIQIIHPDGIDLATANKLGEDVTETLAYQPAELFVKKSSAD